MAILIDPPTWPAHGTRWSHLVSDSDHRELHRFASLLGVPRRGFDLDHYDVPRSLYERALALGAMPVSTRTILQRLRDAGLRVRQIDKQREQAVQRRLYLREEWLQLGLRLGMSSHHPKAAEWDTLGEELISRWNEPHRHYHDVRHLEYVLLSLDQLAVRGETIADVTLLAAWFHDAIYLGSPSDEVDSAKLAVAKLGQFEPISSLSHYVGDLITATAPGAPRASVEVAGAHLLDADTSIFAAQAHRYQQYASDVRQEYQHIEEEAFREARSRILQTYLDQNGIYHTAAARSLWETRARQNLNDEITLLRATKYN